MVGVSLSGDAVLDGWRFARFPGNRRQSVRHRLQRRCFERIFQARNGREVASSEKFPAGQPAQLG
jgi:hypothetical protein